MIFLAGNIKFAFLSTPKIGFIYFSILMSIFPDFSHKEILNFVSPHVIVNITLKILLYFLCQSICVRVCVPVCAHVCVFVLNFQKIFACCLFFSFLCFIPSFSFLLKKMIIKSLIIAWCFAIAPILYVHCPAGNQFILWSVEFNSAAVFLFFFSFFYEFFIWNLKFAIL